MYARRSAAAHEQRIATAALLVGSEAAGKWDTPSRFQAPPTELSVTSQFSLLFKEMQGNPLEHSPLRRVRYFSWSTLELVKC